MVCLECTRPRPVEIRCVNGIPTKRKKKDGGREGKDPVRRPEATSKTGRSKGRDAIGVKDNGRTPLEKHDHGRQGH
jgi:hypothetical protein